MDEAIRSRISDPFFSTKFMERGLGLAAALGIARGHNGTSTAESAPAKGSTFTEAFPAASFQAPPDGPEHGSDHDGHAMRSR